MIRRPPRSTRTDTLFPYTTLFRSTCSSFWASTANSIGSSLNTSLQKPLTIIDTARSEEHTSELQSLMRISYAVFCLKKKNLPKLYPHHSRSTAAHNSLLHPFNPTSQSQSHTIHPYYQLHLHP